MKQYQLSFLIAFSLISPHVPVAVGLGLAAFYTAFGVIFSFLEK